MVHCDVNICVGCKTCEVTCSSFHFGAVSPALSRIRVAKLEEIGIDMAVACLSCLEKSCLVCPTDALSVGEKGEIILDAELCNACELCIDACRVGAVGFYDGLPLFCDLCEGAILCVSTCPRGALSYREGEEISLEAFQQSEGGASQRRALYADVQAEPVREGWQNGVRVDS